MNVEVSTVTGPDPMSTAVASLSKGAGLALRDGTQHSVIQLERPDAFSDVYDRDERVFKRTYKDVQTNWIVVRVVEVIGPGTPNRVLSSQTVEKTIAWPDRAIWIADREIRDAGQAPSLARAIALVDKGSAKSLSEAKLLLERLLQRNDKLIAAYVELGRIAMKSNWGPEGLVQAERYVASALQIDPRDVDVLRLRGYVYTHQGRFKLAEADFTEVAKSDTNNPWLWADWGELRTLQGNAEAAVTMFSKAIASPVTHDRFDRGRLFAFEKLIDLHEKSRSWDALNAVHLQRVKDYGLENCYGAEYALFKLRRRGDTAGAIELVKDRTQQNCANINASEILGMAYYVDWAKSSDSNANEILNRARIFFPPSVRLFLLLGGSEQTIDAVKRLVKSGESIDQTDNRRMNALAYALQQRDTATARRLLQVGSSTRATVGAAEIPIALLPVFAEDLENIKLLKQFGVDYSTLSHQGISATEYARRSGNKKLTDALNVKGTKL